ncbi:MAG: glycosyltransferase family 4 protein, partial [Dehalococcoidia bacterium]
IRYAPASSTCLADPSSSPEPAAGHPAECPVRIVHVIDYFQPMLGYQETFLPREQASMGHEVHVATSDRYKQAIYEQNKSLLGERRIVGAGSYEEDGVHVWRLKTLFELPRAIWIRGLEEKIQELNPDVVIVHGMVHFSAIRVARLKKRLGNFKLIYDDHMAFVASRSPARILYPVFRYIFSPMIQQAADALVGVSDTSKMFMHIKYGIPLERIAVIPLGSDSDVFRFDKSARQELREELSLKENEILFIYVGKSVPEKGPHLLVEASMKLMEKDSRVKVVLVGGGLPSYVERMKQDARVTGVEDRFVWRDAVPNKELPRFYSAADVAVWPRECSMSMMEAMACSLPIIISDSSETTERVGNNNGLTYSGDDASDLARQMERLLNAELRKEMGQNGRKFVEEKLSWKIIARQFIELVS